MKKSSLSQPSWVHKLGLFCAISIGVILYLRLGRDGLFDWDEGIYAELGRQLLITKNIVVSFWNGAPWLEKPPGIAWVSALGIAIMGPSALGARLLMPLFAAYVLYMVYRIGTHLGSWKHGLLAASLLATFNLFLGRTRAVNTDMPLLAALTTTILFLLENRRASWVALTVFVAVWFKGLAGLLPLIVAAPLLISKGYRYCLQVAGYSALFIIPWHLYAYVKYQEVFTTPYLLEQVIKRATAQIEFHFESRWYYFAYLYENLGLGVLLVALLGGSLGLYEAAKNPSKKSLYLTLVWWLLAPLGIFTLAKTRLFWYILPVYPALALLISLAIGYWQKNKHASLMVSVIAVGMWGQALLTSARSVEINKHTAELPDRLQVASQLKGVSSHELAVLVPPSERLSEALLPEIARLSSSFRYGGMPSVVFYYQGPVVFFYDVDKFRQYWTEHESPVGLIARDDAEHVPGLFNEVSSTKTYLGIQKGIYALR